MGLDMYAQVRSTKPQTAVDFNTEEGAEDKELHYWRKHPNLHGWMENLYYLKGGKAESFNCVSVELDLEDLALLEKHVKERVLPSTAGFFFGNSQNDEDEANEDLEFIKEAREAIAGGEYVYYTSWW
jgi:hypothetical protein